MEPANHPTQSLFDLLNAITGLISQYFTAHPGVYDNVVGGVVVLILAALFPLVQKRVARNFRHFVGWLGSKRGFSKLALGAYRRELVNQYGTLVNIYLGKEEELTLRQVFVPLTLRASGTTELSENRSTGQILTDDQQKRLVLLGAPGSGKSTLLKALVAGVSRREWPQFKDLQPVLVSLREFGQAVDKKSLLDWLVEDELPRFGLRNSKPLLESLLAKGRVLLLLDGLDEVAGERLEIVNRAISLFLAKLDKTQVCRVLLTCREQNYDDLPDRDHYIREGFTEYRVAELREAEIREIVRRRQSSFTDKRKSMANYLEQVFRHGDILQLHRNPLLLTLSMGVYLHRPGEEVPHNLAQFYEQSIDNLLRRHNFREAVGSRSANRFKAECKFRLLRHFALQNLIAATEDNRDFETFSFQAVTVAARQLAEEGKVAFKPDQAHEVVKEIQLQAGLLNATRDNECFHFSHRSLNEYCAAAALNRQNEAGFKLISRQLGNPAWRQVIFFYAAIDDDNDNAVRLVETIQQRAIEESDSHLLALAGHCAAVMVQPRTLLRLELLGALTKALLAADLEIRPVLLKSLLALGNDRDEGIRRQLDYTMRQFVQSGKADELIREVGRLEPSVAIQFLGYLANSDSWTRKSAAALGLAQIGSQNKIPLLWKLLLDCRAVGQIEGRLYREVISQLLDLMAEPGGVERLNACKPSPPKVDNSIREEVIKVYPFLTKDNPITNFALLLTWSVEYGLAANIPNQTSCDTEDFDAWQSFLGMVLIRKNTKELKQWKRLPSDKNKWTGKVKTVVFGRLLFGTPLLLGFLLIAMTALMSTSSATNQFSAFLVVWSLIFVVGLFLSMFWLGWKYVLIRRKLFGTLDAFQEDFKRWLLPSDKPLVNGSTPRLMLYSIYRGLLRVFALGWAAILLLGLAAFMNPSSIRGSHDDFNGLAIALHNSTVITDIVHIIYIWIALVFIVFFLPCLNWFDRGKAWYLLKPNRYIHLYQIPGVERWLPLEEKE